MDSGFSATELRVIIALIGAVIFALIYFFGRPKKPRQGRRTPLARGESGAGGDRIEPTFGDPDRLADDAAAADALEPGMQEELDRLGSEIAAERAENAADKKPMPGMRPEQPIERIVTLFVAARPGELIPGPDLVVAAEKAGLTFGDMGIFHRLVDGKPDAGPIFSMANMVKPGNFDMRHIDELQSPGVSFFMALPGPLSALDAWDAMLPTAQRLAELLGGNVLDEERNALGRQRVAHLRDELRAWDRKQERGQIRLR